jgi:predicted TIM-barrel fold metal-dependent hydrolase
VTLQVTRWFEPDDSSSISGARAHLGRFAVVARADSRRTDLPDRVRTALADPLVVAARVFDLETNLDVLRPEHELWPAIANLGKPVCVYAPGHSERLAAIAERHPDLCLVVDHAGVPLSDSSRPYRWLDWAGVLQLASVPNVCVKASALPEACDEVFPYRNAEQRFLALVDTFGARRVMWGSNYTPALRAGTYDQHVDFARRAAAQLPDGEADAVLAGTATRVFGLGAQVV